MTDLERSHAELRAALTLAGKRIVNIRRKGLQPLRSPNATSPSPASQPI